MVYVS